MSFANSKRQRLSRLLALFAGASLLVALGNVLPVAVAHADDDTATVTANVQDGDNGDEPISAHAVYLSTSAGSGSDFYSVSGDTDGSGAVEFDNVPPGTYDVQPDTWNGGTWAIGAIQQVTVVAGDAKSLTFTLFRASATLHGTVEDGDGNPIQATLDVVPDSADLAAVQSSSDSGDGTYVVPSAFAPYSNDLAPGDYEVTASAYGYVDKTEPVSLGSSDSHELDFVLDAAPSVTVSGVVTDKKTGHPVADVGVDLLCGPDSDHLVGQDPLGVAATTDSTGSYSITVLSSLTHCTVQFRDLGPRSSEYPGPAGVHESAYLGDVQDAADATYFDVTLGSPVSGENVALGLGATLNLTTYVQTLDGRVGFDGGFWGVQPTVYFKEGSEWLPYTLLDQQFAGADGTPRGTVQLYGLAAGSYRIGWVPFEGTANPWVPLYWNGASDENSATTITVSIASTATKSPIANVGPVVLHYTQPTTSPDFVDESTLTDGNENDGLIADSNVTQGDDTSVDVGDEYAGQWVYVTANSDSTPLSEGWVQVNKSGTVPVAIGYDTAAGTHKLAVQTASGSVLGWTNLTVTELATHKTFTATPVPKITGTPAVGATLTAVPASWTPTPAQWTYQWQANGSDIVGASDATFVPTSDEFGEKLSVNVTGHLIGVDDATMSSAQTANVGVGKLIAGTPTVTGVRKVDNVLTANPGSWTDGSTFTYQWLRNGVAVAPASSNPTYTQVVADYGKHITVKVTGSAEDYVSASKTSSSSVSATAAGQLSLPTSVTVSASPAVGEPAVALIDGHFGPGVVKLAYQWLLNGKAITGATSSIYTPTSSAVGGVLEVSVVASATGYVTAPKQVSAPSGSVAPGTFVSAVPVLGAAQVGNPILVATGAWSPAPTSFTYVWSSDGVSIPGATSSTYTPVLSDRGSTITVAVTAHRAGYSNGLSGSLGQVVQ